MNQDQVFFSLILKSKQYKIPTKLLSMAYIDPDISNKLLTAKQYEVKSNVDENVFQEFVDYLVNKKTPHIHLDNISQYNQLSDEFDCMQNTIQLFRKMTSNVELFLLLRHQEDLEQKLLAKKYQIKNETSRHIQIIQSLFKNDGISSHSEFQEIKDELYKAVRKSSIYEIDLLTRKKVTQNDIIYTINEDDKTAGIFRCLSKSGTIKVPHSVIFHSEKFVVTRIHYHSFFKLKTIKTIEFPENSELKIIEKDSFFLSSIENIKIPSSVVLIEEKAFSKCEKLENVVFSEHSKLNLIEKSAFNSSSIERISIPSSVSELADGWCVDVPNLTHIEIMPNNGQKNLIFYDDKFILGKSDQKSDIFDVLIFTRRDLEKVIIPSFIRIIGQYAFNNFRKLKIVEFQENSSLEKIDSFSFSGSSIESIIIPSTVTRIGDSAFASCSQLESIQFSENSKLFSIGKFAFFLSSLKSIVLPPLVTQINESTFMVCSNLQKVEFSSNSKLKCIENYAFTSSSIKSLTIPSSLVDFKSICFQQTTSLTEVKIAPNDQQNIILYDDKFILKKSDPMSKNFDVLLLALRNVENVKIPSFIKQIAPNAFDGCNKIKTLEFDNNSNLKLIGTYSFSLSFIESIKIPSSVISIDKFAFSNCNKLKKVEFSIDSKLKLIDEFAFNHSFIESIAIPSNVEIIRNHCFCQCNNLKKLEFRNDSKIDIFDNEVLIHSSIESLSIPSSINLQKNWCAYTPKLNDIKIFVRENNEKIKYFDNKFIVGKSNLNSQNFDVLLFSTRNIKNLLFPAFIKRIGSYSFNQCRELKTVEFPFDSQLEIIDKFAFSYCLFTAISFPPKLKMIDYAAFSECSQLLIVELFDNSECCSFHLSAFGIRNDKVIMIPAKKKVHFFNL